MLRIFVVDDSARVRSALRAVLEQEAGWLVVGEAANGREALKAFYDHRPNVTLMDYSMPEINGLETARHLKEQDTSAVILMVTADPTIQLQREAKKTGIQGFCPKDKVSCLLTAIKAVAQGQTYFHYREPAHATA